MNALVAACDEKKETALKDVLGFEIVYVTFYSRGLPGPTRMMYEPSAPNQREGPAHAYFKKHILPAVVERESADKRLEETLDFDSIWKSAGTWNLYGEGSRRTGNLSFRRIQQTDPEAGDAFVCFRKPLFDEAILTGQAKVLALGSKPGSPVYCFGYHVDRTLQGHGPTATMARAQELDKRWMWFRIHFMKLGGGKWTSVRWMWHEGKQPYDMRRVPLTELPPRKQSSIDAKLLQAGGSMTIDAKGNPAIGFGSRYAAVEWRVLGLEILQPAGASDSRRVGGQTFMTVGKAVRSDDFTRGLGDWKFGIWPGPAGPNDVVWEDAKNLGMAVEKVDFRGTKKPGLVFTSRAPAGKRAMVSRASIVDRKAFAVSAYLRFSPDPACNISLWNMAGTVAKEKKLKAGGEFARRYANKWVQVVTQFVRIKGEGGESLIDCRTYWDGTMVSHEVSSGPGGPVYMTVEGEARVEMTDFVVNELVPVVQRKDGKR